MKTFCTVHTICYKPKRSPCPLNCWLRNRQHSTDVSVQLTTVVCQHYCHGAFERSMNLVWGTGGALNWFFSASCCWLKITWRYIICWPDPLTCTSFWPPPRLATFLWGKVVVGGIRLLSIQGEEPEALWAFRSCNMGPTQLSSSECSQGGMKRNAEWMADGSLTEWHAWKWGQQNRS